LLAHHVVSCKIYLCTPLDALLESGRSEVYPAQTCAPDARSGPLDRAISNSIDEAGSMGLMDFVKDAGEKLFGHGPAQAAVKEAAADPSSQAKVQAANSAAADAILEYVKSQHLTATGLTVTYDGATSTVSVFGVAPDQATREKIVLCCGNVAGVSKVNDMMSVDRSEPEAQFYTVVSGDNLSKISKQFYGDANRYMKIFEANKPMLTSPDRIYPGQKLRIPAQ
jgi:nucleoid-associated protein YgaU